MPRPEHPPVLRFLADRGRLVRSRPAAVAVALAARAARLPATTLWPDPDAPLLAVDVSAPGAAEWMRATFEPHAPQAPHPATRNALRARAALLGGPSRRVVAAAAVAAGRPLASPRVAVYSPSGLGMSKATCFVFERGGSEPVVVVKGMPDRRWLDRLRAEVGVVAELRTSLAGHSAVASGLPLPPLWEGDVNGDWLVVEPVDPLAACTGHEDRPRALGWLRALHEATATARPWEPHDSAAAVAVVRRAWELGRPARSEPAAEAAEARLRPLQGALVPRCVSHGDFWAGNVAVAPDGALRVFDWEWARRAAPPFFDLWTYELGPLRRRAEDGATDLSAGLCEAAGRVEAELGARGLPAAFALAALAPSLGELAYRVRWATGMAGGSEPASRRLMAAAEEILVA